MERAWRSLHFIVRVKSQYAGLRYRQNLKWCSQCLDLTDCPLDKIKTYSDSIIFTILIPKFEKQLKVFRVFWNNLPMGDPSGNQTFLHSSGKSYYPWDHPKTNFSRQPFVLSTVCSRFFHCFRGLKRVLYFCSSASCSSASRVIKSKGSTLLVEPSPVWPSSWLTSCSHKLGLRYLISQVEVSGIDSTHRVGKVCLSSLGLYIVRFLVYSQIRPQISNYSWEKTLKGYVQHCRSFFLRSMYYGISP